MAHTPNLTLTVARKELREVLRDGRLRLLGGIVGVLAIAALGFGTQHAKRLQQARTDASERAEKQWQGQGDKNPHVAAHYGTWVFAPTTAATAIDPGVSAFLGRALKIEAHKRNLAAHASAQDGGGRSGVGGFTVAMVLQLLVPLLIIALGYGMWSRERERGTLRQLLSTGVSGNTLLVGKSLALIGLLAALIVPASILTLIVLAAIGGTDAGTWPRIAMLWVAYSVYFGAIGGFTLAVSALSKSSRSALVALVAGWGLLCLATPRAATEIAAVVRPLPSHAAFARGVSKALQDGLDGKTPRETAIEAMVSDTLQAQGMSATGMLVDESFVAGVELQAEAKWEDRIYDHHIAKLEAQFVAQEELAAQFAVVSPYIAIHTLSAAFCGTDYLHHRDFTSQAEVWRKSLIELLNKAFADNAGAEGWSYKAGPELWKKAPPFAYTQPTIGSVVAQHRFSALVLFGWLLLAWSIAWAASRRVRVA